MGPPGEKLMPPNMKKVMKGAKGDHGYMGDPGFTGPRGDYSHIHTVIIFFSSTQKYTSYELQKLCELYM